MDLYEDGRRAELRMSLNDRVAVSPVGQPVEPVLRPYFQDTVRFEIFGQTSPSTSDRIIARLISSLKCG